MAGTMLFADASPEARAQALAAAQPGGCRILPVSSGRDALWALSRERPDMVVAEVELPGIDGIALAWHVRAWFPDIPVVLMSSEFGEADLAQLRPLYDAFLPKPVSPERLAELAARVSAGRVSQAAAG